MRRYNGLTADYSGVGSNRTCLLNLDLGERSGITPICIHAPSNAFDMAGTLVNALPARVLDKEGAVTQWPPIGQLRSAALCWWYAEGHGMRVLLVRDQIARNSDFSDPYAVWQQRPTPL